MGVLVAVERANVSTCLDDGGDGRETADVEHFLVIFLQISLTLSLPLYFQSVRSSYALADEASARIARTAAKRTAKRNILSEMRRGVRKSDESRAWDLKCLNETQERGSEEREGEEPRYRGRRISWTASHRTRRRYKQ